MKPQYELFSQVGVIFYPAEHFWNEKYMHIYRLWIFILTRDHFKDVNSCNRFFLVAKTNSSISLKSLNKVLPPPCRADQLTPLYGAAAVAHHLFLEMLQ